MKFANLLSFLLISGLFSCDTASVSESASNVFEADVIVYGGTSGAVTAAVQVKKMGKTVILVSPDVHLGGLSSGGLGYTDTGDKSVIGGLSREFYQRVFEIYEDDSSWKWQERSEYGNKGQGTPAIDGEHRTQWIFEPHVAEQVFEDFVKDHDIEVMRDEWIDRDSKVEVENGKITEFVTLSGKTFRGQMFIDATYEGDLMAEADVSYHVGRESAAQYGEEYNGVQVGVFQHGHWFMEDIDPYVSPGDPTSGLLPRISAEPPGANGSADDKIQAYCFRMCLSNHPDNRVPFAKPSNYDPMTYQLLARVYAKGWDETFQKFDPVPNRKTDTNNHGPFSTDNIGMNYDYPEASYERRREIIKEHEDYQKGLMYFLANDEQVPDEVRDEMNKYGLAKDEFVDNGNWPHQIYVREARRMLGEFVMTENELLARKPVMQPVGMGSYAMDSHNTQRFVTEDGFVQNEGDIGVHVPKAYQIDYRSLVPKKNECTNLTVPICVSSSHIAFGSIRMEPVFMILGQSAATAAVMALEKGIAVQDLQYGDLRAQLIKDGQILAKN